MHFRAGPPTDNRMVLTTGFGAAAAIPTRVLRTPSGRKPATLSGDDRGSTERKYLRFAGVGIQYALTILVLTFAGIWLDEWLGTDPLFLIALLLLGFVGATWSLVNSVLGPSKKRDPGR
jgi:F0F1-type ATP synthase assembly protein I